MSPQDAIHGWDDEANAEQYATFAREYPMYADTSRDLATRAALGDARVVLDLCGGTGVTAAALLRYMPESGRVISVDTSDAMQKVGKRELRSSRITWILARAEEIASHVSGQADAVVCNSAIWKTELAATFAAVKKVLRPGGRFVFNIGGGFVDLGNRDGSARPRTGPSLNELINAVAVLNYGYVPSRKTENQNRLTLKLVEKGLREAAFSVLSLEVLTYESSMEEKRAWLSIPVFSRPSGLPQKERMEILQKAYARVDQTQLSVTEWLVVTAEG